MSALGDWLALTPLALALQESTGSGLVVAGLFIAFWSPAIVLAGPAGLLVDRVPTRRLLIAVSTAQAAVALVLAFTDSTAGMLTLVALLGAGFAFSQPAEFALVPVVAGERVHEANGYVETARYAGFTLGPLIGGVLAATGGTRVALLVNALSFVVVAAAALAIRAERRALPAAAGAPKDRARDGLLVLFRDRLLALVMVVAFASLLFMTASVAAEVFFVKDDLEAGDVAYGALLTAWTVGMALGALVLSRRYRGALALAALVAVVIQSAGVGAPTLWVTLPFAFAAFFVGGLAHGLKNVLIRTVIHERVPERLHGRAFAAYNGLRNGAELVAMASGGLLVAAIGGRGTLFLAGLVPALAGLAGLAAYRLGNADALDRPAAATPEPSPADEDVPATAAPPVATT